MITIRIVRTDIYRFSIPFVTPMKVGREVLHDRQGFLIVLTDSEGRCGYGEIAPLPGFDVTPLDRCLQDIPSLRSVLKSARLNLERFQMTAPLLGVVDLPASAWTAYTLFGVESALLGLSLQHEETGSLHPVLPLPGEKLRIAVNGLFIPKSAKTDGPDQQIRNLKNSGTTTVKIKIGRLPEEEEIRQIRHLVDEIGSDISLRLDGNRNLTPEAYQRYYEALSSLPVEYVEEPLPEEEMGRTGDVPWPLALDESLASLLDPEEPNLSGLDSSVRTVILKPGVFNGLHAMARLIGNVEQAGIQAIFSSAFNTGATLAILGVFSRLAGLPPETAHGLDTLRYLAADVLLPSPEISGGMLEIPGRLFSGEASLNEDCIRERIP